MCCAPIFLNVNYIPTAIVLQINWIYNCNRTEWSLISLTHEYGWHKVPLPIDHNHYNLRSKWIQEHLIEKISSVETLFCGVSGFCYGYYNQLCDWVIWRCGLNMISCFNCPITGVRLSVRYSWLSDCPVWLQLYRLVSAKIKQLEHQNHLRTL